MQNILIGLLIGLFLLGMILTWWGAWLEKKGGTQYSRKERPFFRRLFLGQICIVIPLLTAFFLSHFSPVLVSSLGISLYVVSVLMNAWISKCIQVIYKRPVVYLPLTLVALVIAIPFLLFRPFGPLLSLVPALTMIAVAISSVLLQTDFLARRDSTGYKVFSFWYCFAGILFLFNNPFMNIVSSIVGCTCIAYGIFCYSLSRSVDRQ